MKNNSIKKSIDEIKRIKRKKKFSKRENVLPQFFDLRSGEGRVLNLKKVFEEERKSFLEKQEIVEREIQPKKLENKKEVFDYKETILERPEDVQVELMKPDMEQRRRDDPSHSTGHSIVSSDVKPEIDLLSSYRVSLVKKLFEFIRSKISSFENSSHEAFSALGQKPNYSFQKSIISFAVICILLTSLISFLAFYQRGSEIKNKVMGSAGIAAEHLMSAKDAIFGLDFDLASSEFETSSQNFTSAQEELEELGSTTIKIAQLIPGSVSSGIHLLRGGENLAEAGKYLSRAIQPFMDTTNILEGTAGVKTGKNDNKNLLDILRSNKDNLEIAFNKLEKANLEFDKVNPRSLPEPIKTELVDIKKKIPAMKDMLYENLVFYSNFLNILGDDGPKRYLILNQNNNEIRATGGFIGSYSLIDINNGKVENILVEGVYSPDGQLREKINPPEPIRRINPRWFMRDANWFFDFPTSAQKVASFYEKTGNPSVDGVISMTPDVLKELLRVVGPIEMSKYDVVLDHENFVKEIQYEVEVDYEKENRPKKILADMTPKLINKILNLEKEKWIEILQVFSKAMKRKDIMIYFFDEDLEKVIREKGLSGEVRSTDRDYFAVVSSNVAGNKSSAYIEDEIEHKAMIQEDGSIINLVELTRKNTGDYSWLGSTNIEYVRFFTPKGSQLIEAKGFTPKGHLPKRQDYTDDDLVKQIEDQSVIDENTQTIISEENGKTVFANWLEIAPGETRTITLKYKLPFKITTDIFLKQVDKYSLFVQRQAGTKDIKFKSSLYVPSNFNVDYYYPQDGSIIQEAGLIKYGINLDSDKFYGVVLEGE